MVKRGITRSICQFREEEQNGFEASAWRVDASFRWLKQVPSMDKGKTQDMRLF
jgi:hypothetical protein